MTTPDPPERWRRAKDILTRVRRTISTLATLVLVALRLINILRNDGK